MYFDMPRNYFLTLLTLRVSAGHGIELLPKAVTPPWSHIRITWDAFKSPSAHPTPPTLPLTIILIWVTWLLVSGSQVFLHVSKIQNQGPRKYNQTICDIVQILKEMLRVPQVFATQSVGGA